MVTNAKVIKALPAELAEGIVIGILMRTEKGFKTQDVLTGSFKNFEKSFKETAASEIKNFVELKVELVSAIKSIIKKGEKSLIDDNLEHTNLSYRR